jgi:AhpD family alkylhydroperoxidase
MLGSGLCLCVTRDLATGKTTKCDKGSLNGWDILVLERRFFLMMMDWNAYQAQVQQAIAEIGRMSPDIVRGYRMVSGAGKQADLLGAKTRELIALAVAVTLHCDGCIAIHTEAALKNGATREEIVEALGVAIAINAGSTLIYSARVMDAVKVKTETGS